MQEELRSGSQQLRGELLSLRTSVSESVHSLQEALQLEQSTRGDTCDLLHTAITAISTDIDRLRASTARVVEQLSSLSNRVSEQIQVIAADVKSEETQRLRDVSVLQEALRTIHNTLLHDTQRMFWHSDTHTAHFFRNG